MLVPVPPFIPWHFHPFQWWSLYLKRWRKAQASKDMWSQVTILPWPDLCVALTCFFSTKAAPRIHTSSTFKPWQGSCVKWICTPGPSTLTPNLQRNALCLRSQVMGNSFWNQKKSQGPLTFQKLSAERKTRVPWSLWPEASPPRCTSTSVSSSVWKDRHLFLDSVRAVT